MEKILYWKIQAVNNSKEIEVGSKEMEVYKRHNLKDFKTREEMSDLEAVEHYKTNAWKNPLFSRMLSLTLAFVEKDVIRVSHFTGDERDLLINFINTTKSSYFNDFTLACFDAEYLLPYLGIRLDFNKIKEPLVDGLIYRGRKPWNLSSICVRDFYQGSGAYKPTLKELAYIFGIEDNFIDKEYETVLSENDASFHLQNSAVNEIKALINIHRAMNGREPILEVNVAETEVKDVKIKEADTLLHELYESKNFDSQFQLKLKKDLLKRKVLKKDIPFIKEMLEASYFERIDVMAFNKAELKTINEERALEIKEFLDNLK